MRLTPDMTVGPVNLLALRKFVRWLGENSEVLAADAATELGVTVDDLGPAIHEQYLLLGDGLPEGPTVKIGATGVALSMASLRRYKKATCQKALDELVERAKAIEADRDLAWGVNRIHLYGSFLHPDQHDDFGDVDVWVEMYPREIPEEFDGDRVAWSLHRLEMSGSGVGSYVEAISFSETEVRRLVKGRSPVLSVCLQPILPEIERRTVWERFAAAPAPEWVSPMETLVKASKQMQDFWKGKLPSSLGSDSV